MPSHKQALLSLLRLYQRTQRRAQALAVAETAVKEHPEDVELLELFADILK